MPNLCVPEGSSWVAGGLLSTVFVHAFQYILVNRHRRAAGIAYPQMYAEKAEMEKSHLAVKFNCAQRAHQNTLENIPAMYVVTVLAGLKYPKTAGALLTFWSINRIVYTLGYITGNPAKRNYGALGGLAFAVLIGYAVAAVAPLIREGI